MATSLNKVMLIGNLGSDAEVKFTPSNQSVTTIRLATSRRYKTKDDNWTEETSWHTVVAWNLFENQISSLKKGKKVYVEGRLNYREYEKEGQKHKVTDIIADEIIMLDKREGSENPSGFAPSSELDKPQATKFSKKGSSPENNSFDSIDDEVPF